MEDVLPQHALDLKPDRLSVHQPRSIPLRLSFRAPAGLLLERVRIGGETAVASHPPFGGNGSGPGPLGTHSPLPDGRCVNSS